jgi:hypothetical protein
MRIKGQEQIAAVFGVAPKTITEWQVLGFPVAFQGGPGVASEYDTPACMQWLVDREVRKVRVESPKDRVFRLQGDKLEREELKEARLLIPASEVEPLWASAILGAREFLVGEPARLASLAIGLTKPALEALLRETFEQFLGRLANWQAAGDDPDEAIDEGDSEDEDAPE